MDGRDGFAGCLVENKVRRPALAVRLPRPRFQVDELIGHGSSPGLEIEIYAVDAFRDRSEPFEKGGLAEIEEIAAITCSCVIKAAEKPRPFPNLCPPEVGTPDDEKSTFFGPVGVNNKNREFVAGHDRHSEERLRVPPDAAGGKGKLTVVTDYSHSQGS